jgi:hypothetical protein
MAVLKFTWYSPSVAVWAPYEDIIHIGFGPTYPNDLGLVLQRPDFQVKSHSEVTGGRGGLPTYELGRGTQFNL